MTNEDQIRELIESWAKAVRDKNMAGILANHSQDILLFDVPPPLQSKGIDAYKKSWEFFFPWLGESGGFEVSEIEITAGEEVAFCHGIIHCGGTENSGEKVNLEVRLTVGYRKIDGQWMVTHEHHSEPSTIT